MWLQVCLCPAVSPFELSAFIAPTLIQRRSSSSPPHALDVRRFLVLALELARLILKRHPNLVHMLAVELMVWEQDTCS